MFFNYDNSTALENQCSLISDKEVISALQDILSHSYYGAKMPTPSLDALSAEDIKAIKLDIAQRKMGIFSQQNSLKQSSHGYNSIVDHLEAYKRNSTSSR